MRPLTGLLALLPLALWILQLRYPPLSFPAFGLMELILLAGGAVLLCMKVHSQKLPLARHPALLPGLLFLGWLVIRWVSSGLSVRGLETVSTWLWVAVYLGIGFVIYQLPEGRRLPKYVLLMVAGMATFCGLHGMYQYFVGYQQDYNELLGSLGGRAPDQTELGLLYHLQLKRVASILGDPNALATFLALSLAASLELATGLRGWRRGLPLMAALICLGGIGFTGSRGGLLDVGFVFVAMAFLVIRYGGWRGPVAAGVVLLCMVAPRIGGAESTTETVPVSGWKWRSSTIQERVYYLEVGAKMFKMNPAMGLGPGSVDRYFGRLKSSEARETRYLHNWVIQVAAELGLVGLGLMGWFFGAVIYRCFRARMYAKPVLRGLGVMIALYLLDGLVQITWNQRELMGLFGLCLGITMAETGCRMTAKPGRSALTFGLIAVAAGLCVFEVPYLKSKSAKQLAVDLMIGGEIREAKKYWQRAMVWLPIDPDPPAALSEIYLSENQITAARNSILKALEIQPDSAALNARAGAVYRTLGESDKADIFLTNALTYYPTKPEYLYDMAELQRSRGKTDKALTFARLALKYNYMDDNKAKYQGLISALELQTSGSQVSE